MHAETIKTPWVRDRFVELTGNGQAYANHDFDALQQAEREYREFLVKLHNGRYRTAKVRGGLYVKITRVDPPFPGQFNTIVHWETHDGCKGKLPESQFCEFSL